MLIDPTGVNLKINVETFESRLENEHQISRDFRGYSVSKFKGNVHRVEITGTIYGDDKDITLRYLESMSFDDAIEIQIDVLDEKVEVLPGSISVVKYSNIIEGYLIITDFKPETVFSFASPYVLNGYFFPKDFYKLQGIGSYFGLPPVSTSVISGSLSASNSTQTISLAAGNWDKIQVNSFEITPIDYLGYRVFCELLDAGDNVAKIQVNTCVDDSGVDGPIVDISYIIINRGGFKLITNIAWEIKCNATKSMFNTPYGPYDYIKRAPDAKEIGSSSALLIDGSNHVTNISNNASFYWDLDSIGEPQIFYNRLKTQIIAGNIISIAETEETAVEGSSTGGTLATGLNITVTAPYPGEDVPVVVEGSDNVVYVPVEFNINDGSRVTSIEVKLLLVYVGSTWTFDRSVNTTTTITPGKFKNGGSLYCRFILPSDGPTYYINAGILVIAHYDGSNYERGLTKYTFSINKENSGTLFPIGGNRPIAEVAALKSHVQDYPIYQLSDLKPGIYDLYFYISQPYGRCVVDLGLYTNSLNEEYTDANYIAYWRQFLNDYINGTPPVGGVVPLPDTASEYSNYKCIDYNAGGMHCVMKDITPGDYGSPSIAIFKRTIIVKPTTDTHIHARMMNVGSATISGFTVFAVPVYSHLSGYTFIGDHVTATSPNVKNRILMPK